MIRQIKFTIGNAADGYKSIEIAIDGAKVFCKILRSGLLGGGKKISSAVKISDACLNELDALKIFSWEENYSSAQRGNRWQLTYAVDDEIYRGRGEGAFPENWEQFMDWLDAFFPELEFVDRRRLEHVTVEFAGERLVIDRQEKTLTLDKPNSNHIYDIGDETKKIFAACQKFFDGVERTSPELNFSTKAKFELLRHNGAVENFETPYNENFLPGLANFIAAIHAPAADLSAEIFSSQVSESISRRGKLILCKVQFPGSYKHYTYSTDDETLAVGDIVDVPVGRNNDVTWARLVDIGYFDEYETPIPVDRIKKIIGKHIADEWENI